MSSEMGCVNSLQKLRIKALFNLKIFNKPETD